MAPSADTLTSVKRALGRVAAGLVVAAVAFTHVGAVPAQAEPERRHLKAQDCEGFTATATDAVPHAWHLERLHMDDVWQVATGKGVTVAVIDTGVGYLGSPYFDGKVTAYDYLGGMTEADIKRGSMDCTHGTIVASLIAGARPNGKPLDTRTDFSGIAPDAKLITYRTLSVSEPPQDGQNPDTLEATIAAVRDATAQKVDIINLSQTSNLNTAHMAEFEAAIAAAIKAGIVVVAAAGNNGAGLVGPAAPAHFPGVIAVGISGASDSAAPEAYPNEDVVLGAPGADMVALVPSMPREAFTVNNQAYVAGRTGSSYAAPVVSGVVALMLEADPSLTPAQVKQRLIETADPPPNAVPEVRLGFGIVNPMRALAGMGRPQTANPSAMATMAPTPVTTRPKPDMTPAFVGVGLGVGALLTTALALVGAIAIPPAVRRAKSKRH